MNILRGVMGINHQEYICSTVDHIQRSLDYIGDGQGTIILNFDTLDFAGVTVTISGGGDYVIRGGGDRTVCDAGGNVATFSVTNARSVVFQDFKFDINDHTGTPASINISDTTNNPPVLIHNIRWHGDNTHGYGVSATSNNITVRNCFFEDIQSGVQLLGDNNLIEACYFKDVDQYAVILGGDNSVVRNNTIFGVSVRIRSGIYLLNCNYCTVQSNIVKKYEDLGIIISSSDHNSITGNEVADGDANDGGNTIGISIIGGDDNILSGNNVVYTANSGVGGGYGIGISGDENTITGNNVTISKTGGLTDSGTNTYNASNNLH